MAENKKTVLIVDDAKFMREILKGIIVKGGFEVAGEASNGKQAIELYQKLKPDLVTMDIIMPVMDGLTALGEIKKIDTNSRVFMITALDQEALQEEARKLGAAGFISKPFRQGDVLRALYFS